MSGSGQKTQDVILFQGALKLIMFLPGNGAKDFRANAADILTKFFAGDAGLVAQIEENAESSHPICQMARASLPLTTTAIEEKKRKRVEDMEMKERQVALRVQIAQAEISEAEAKKIYAEANVLDAKANVLGAEVKVKEAQAKKITREADVLQAEAKVKEADAKLKEAQANKITMETNVIGLGSKKIIAETRVINSEADKLEAESKAKEPQSDTATVIPGATPLLVTDAAQPQEQPAPFTLIPWSVHNDLTYNAVMRLMNYKFLSAIINVEKYLNPDTQEFRTCIIGQVNNTVLYNDFISFLQIHNYPYTTPKIHKVRMIWGRMNGFAKFNKQGAMWYNMYYSTIKAELIKLNAYDTKIKV